MILPQINWCVWPDLTTCLLHKYVHLVSIDVILSCICKLSFERPASRLAFAFCLIDWRVTRYSAWKLIQSVETPAREKMQRFNPLPIRISPPELPNLEFSVRVNGRFGISSQPFDNSPPRSSLQDCPNVAQTTRPFHPLRLSPARIRFHVILLSIL